MFQVDQRVWPALPVEGRATRSHKAHSLVESNRLAVLLVHIRRHLRMHRQTMANEDGTYSATPVSRIDEQRFHMPVLDQHECKRIVIGIDRKPERSLREKRAHQFIERQTILRQKKVMRGINGVAPDLDDARRFIRPGNAGSPA